MIINKNSKLWSFINFSLKIESKWIVELNIVDI